MSFSDLWRKSSEDWISENPKLLSMIQELNLEGFGGTPREIGKQDKRCLYDIFASNYATRKTKYILLIVSSYRRGHELSLACFDTIKQLEEFAKDVLYVGYGYESQGIYNTKNKQFYDFEFVFFLKEWTE